MKTILVLGYQHFLIPNSFAGEIINSISEWQEVDRKYVDGKELYAPTEQGRDIEIKLVPDDSVRPPTAEETENQEIKELKQSLTFANSKKNEQAKEIEELKCKLKLMELEAKPKEDEAEI